MKNFSKNIDDYYLNDYERIMEKGLVGKMWKYIHKLLDKPFTQMSNICLIEVGSGSGQHFNCSKLQPKEYLEVDLRNPESKSTASIKNFENRRFVQDDAIYLAKIPDKYFDGLIATCLLAHLQDMETALINWRRVVKPGGILSIYIPNEPGILYPIVRGLITKPRIQKAGYDDDFLHWKDHRNHFPGMRSMIKHVFTTDTIRFSSFPLKFLNWNFGLFTIVKINVEDKTDI